MTIEEKIFDARLDSKDIRLDVYVEDEKTVLSMSKFNLPAMIICTISLAQTPRRGQTRFIS